MPRVEDLERRLEQALGALLRMHEEGTLPPVLEPLLAMAPPRGMDAEVELRRIHGERGGRADEWSPRAGEVVVSFFDAEDREGPIDDGREPLADLITVLAQAERNPSLSFVALKFLRDRLLPQSRWPWTRSMERCQDVIAEAIDTGVVLTTKKTNPRNPAFPVTALYLNREHPRVRTALAAASDGAVAGGAAETEERVAEA